MANPSTEEMITSTPVETKKQRKKQARLEARMMLKAEQAKKDVQKAEQKVTKARSNFEASNVYLRKLEQKLAALRTPHQKSSDGHFALNSDQSLEQLETPEVPTHTAQQDTTATTVVSDQPSAESSENTPLPQKKRRNQPKK